MQGTCRPNMICPHCYKDTNKLSDLQIERVLSSCKSKYTSDTLKLLRKFSTSLPNFNRLNLAQFLSRISEYEEDDIYFGIEYFLQNEYNLKGKSWEYCSAIIARRYNTRILESQSLPSLPKNDSESASFAR